MILRVLLSTEINDLPEGVDEEEGRKYELPTMLFRRSSTDCEVGQAVAVIRHIRVQTP